MVSRVLADNHYRRALLAMMCCVPFLSTSACMRAPGPDSTAMSWEPLAAPRRAAPVSTPPAVAAATGDSATRTEFHNVNFHMTPDVALRIRYLRGAMRSVDSGQPVVFDDKSSFVIDIDSATVGLTPTNLEHLMNGYVFAYRGAPLRNLRFAVEGERLVQSGIMHKVVDIPFEITAALSVTPEGKIRIHPTAIQIFGVDGMGLMKALGITLDRLLDLRQAKGVSVEKNDLLLSPDRLLPPPAIAGRVVGVSVEGGEVVQFFGADSGAAPSAVRALPPLDSTADNYMRFRGGTLRFGKLFMVQADMQIIDTEQSDPFDFSIDEYNRQLVAGYSKNTPEGALKVYMPDLDDLGKDSRKREVGTAREQEAGSREQEAGSRKQERLRVRGSGNGSAIGRHPRLSSSSPRRRGPNRARLPIANLRSVIPAEAGTQGTAQGTATWVPACAGMTKGGGNDDDGCGSRSLPPGSCLLPPESCLLPPESCLLPPAVPARCCLLPVPRSPRRGL